MQSSWSRKITSCLPAGPYTSTSPSDRQTRAGGPLHTHIAVIAVFFRVCSLHTAKTSTVISPSMVATRAASSQSSCQSLGMEIDFSISLACIASRHLVQAVFRSLLLTKTTSGSRCECQQRLAAYQFSSPTHRALRFPCIPHGEHDRVFMSQRHFLLDLP
jgi:hypothetical protein